MNKKTPLALASAALLTVALGGCASTGMDTAADSPDAMADTAMASGASGSTAGSTLAGATTAGTTTTGAAAAGMTGDTQAGASTAGSPHAHGLPGGTPPTPSSAAEALTLVALVDQHELKLAQLTQSRQVDEPVREYAAMMIADHAPHLEKTRTLLESAGGMQQGSAAAQQLMMFDRQTQQRLDGLQGEAYARAYIDHMVHSHQMGIQMLEASMGVATEPAQREFLQMTKDTMQKHLQRAQQLQSQLGG